MDLCGNCAKPDSTLRCGRCKLVVYCSRQCQGADWKASHKFCCRPSTTSRPAEHEAEVREALQSVDKEEIQEGAIRTDADQLGAQIRATPLHRHDAVVKEVGQERLDEDEGGEEDAA